MRIPIREQLGLLVLSCSLLSLMVLALATWFQSRDFTIDIRLSGLSLTASLKAAQLSATVLLYESQARSVATRVLIQSALDRYRNGTLDQSFVDTTTSDLAGALGAQSILVQAIIFPALDDGNLTALSGLVNVTSDSISGDLRLPYDAPNGSAVYFGDPGLGYPPTLYPNLTYSGKPNQSDYRVQAAGRTLDPNGVLVNGPLILDGDAALLSATTAIVNNTNVLDVLGWLTVVVNASMLFDVRNSAEGLGRTGEVLIVGPATNDNKFNFNIRSSENFGTVDDSMLRFVLPPSDNASIAQRHVDRADPDDAALPFLASSFPAIVRAWTANTGHVNNADALLDTRNEQGQRVAIGWAQIKTAIVDWVLVVEQSHAETVEPIKHLRNILLICVFSVTGGLLVLTFPLTHYCAKPIRQLRAATRRTVEPYQPDDNSIYSGSQIGSTHDPEKEDDSDASEGKKEGFLEAVTKWATNASPPRRTGRSSHARRQFRIPSKVPERRHLVHDELTDLTTKFNEMSDELLMQYERLEERVKERTAELELAKQAAEAANQSKTLFIANISHELKTPLNGILGLTQICMHEEDPTKIKSTLNTVYKSGDLLLHLLTDLLTFSKNEVGQQLSIDEAEFKLSDLSAQLMPTFDRQAKEGQIKLEVIYEGTNDSFGNSDTTQDKLYGPEGTGRVKDMCLWGDKNRILQVLMNFTSNSLKFTPPQGSVTIRVRCLGLAAPHALSRTNSERKSSFASRNSKTSSKKRVRTSDTSLTGGSDSDENKRSSFRRRFRATESDGEDGKKSILKKRPRDSKVVNINLGGGTTTINRIVSRQRSRSPPPLNTKVLDFEFEVEDTGPGIPEDQQHKIFEPFVQGDLGLSKKYGGTGLGLSICAQLASLMAGELSLDSAVGRGSKFTMRLPLRYMAEKPGSVDSGRPSARGSFSNDRLLAAASTTAMSTEDNSSAMGEVPRVLGLSQPFVAKDVRPPTRPLPAHTVSSELKMMKKAESEAAQQGSKVRVLVAEDNKINQEVVLRMLKMEDVYDVTIAKDGQEAYDMVKQGMESDQGFHLVFMDVQMPNVDGIQSTKMIRGMGFNAPIVALTAFAEKSNEDECMASGMDYFLAKPIRRPALKQVLKRFATIQEEDDPSISPGTVIPTTNAESKNSDHISPDSVDTDTTAPTTEGTTVSVEELSTGRRCVAKENKKPP